MRNNSRKNIYKVPYDLEDAISEQNRIALTIDLGAINEDIYKGEIIIINDREDPYFEDEEYEIRYKLRKIYYSKCAYCESVEFKPDVEHYRPKKSVTNPNGNDHGYYWLCYEWTNLLPACSDCNSGNGKWNKFPISGTRKKSPPLDSTNNLLINHCKIGSITLRSEGPLLLNPEVDHPELFLKILWNGKLEGTDGLNGKGWSSINTCDLNRGNLIKARKSIIDDIIDRIDGLLILFRVSALSAIGLDKALKIEFSRLFKFCDIQVVFSFVYYYLYKNFTSLINDKFASSAKEEIDLILQTFNEFKLRNVI